MSTRGAVGFVADGKWYVMYNHMDSYPSELGMTVLEFCKSIENWDSLKDRVRKVELVNEDDKPTQEQLDLYAGYALTSILGVSLNGGELDNWYNLLRQLHNGRILYEIANGNVVHMTDDHTFLADSGFCEWAYVIDLDEMTLNVYKGFNNKKYTDTPLPPDIDPTINGTQRWNEPGYEDVYPVKMLYAYNLNRLPEFILGVTNEFKREYRLTHQDTLAGALNKLR